MRALAVAPTIAILMALGCLMAGSRALRLLGQDHFAATQRYEDIYYLPPTHWLPVVSLGYREAMADLIWMRSLIYFGEELGAKGHVQHVFRYGRGILHLDPHFRRAYRWIGMAGLYRPGDVSIDEMYEAVSILEEGSRRFPEDGKLAWELGATLSYEVAPRIKDKKEQARARTRGTEFLMKAARLGAGPAWIALSNSSQLRRLGKLEQAARHLEEMYAVVKDPKVREEMARRIAEVRNEAHAEAFKRTQQELEEERLENFPYVPADLYLFVGPRVKPGK